MKQERPVFISLTKYRFPRMAVVSILHRISGVVLFLVLPILLYTLHESLLSQQNFAVLLQTLNHPIMKLVMWVVLSAVLFHFLAGIRHMMMDLGFAESLQGGKTSATVLLVLAVVLIILVGVWLWW